MHFALAVNRLGIERIQAFSVQIELTESYPSASKNIINCLRIRTSLHRVAELNSARVTGVLADGVVMLTLGRTRKLIPPPWYKEVGGGIATPPPGFYTPTVVQGGGRGVLQPLPWVFAVLQYLGINLTLIDSLSFNLQDKVNIVGYGTAGGP